MSKVQEAHQFVCMCVCVCVEKVLRRGCAVLYAEITSTIACNSVSFFVVVLFFVLFCFGSFLLGGWRWGQGRGMLVYV